MYTHPQSIVRRGTRAALRAGVAAAASTVALSSVAALPAAAHEVPAPPSTPAAPAAPAAQTAAQGPTETATHVVARGDSLSKIAAAYGYTDDDGWRRLFDANPEIDNPDVVFVGQSVRVPASDEEFAARDLPVYEAPAPAAAPSRRAERSGRSATRAAAPAAPSTAGAGVWDQLAACESGGNWSINTGNGYSGGLQFHPRTWTGHGGGQYAPTANQASRDQQIAVAQRVQASQGWGAWPACSRKLGLR